MMVSFRTLRTTAPADRQVVRRSRPASATEVKGGEFPLVTVRTRLREAAAGEAAIRADLEVEFAGQKVPYKQVSFQQSSENGATKITGTIPATLSEFKIDPPTLFTIPVRNAIPVRVEMTWLRQS